VLLIVVMRRDAVPRSRVALAQGVYYLLTGVWPLASIRSFQAVTGPKTDLWLVKTVGVLVALIGGVLLVGGVRRRPTPEVELMGAGAAAGLAGIDTVYATKRRISAIYLLDAVLEALLVLAWALGRRRERWGRRTWK
jgi:hypothetical protein